MRVIKRQTLVAYYTKHPAAVIKFTPSHVLIRFIGTHAEYDKIKDIQNI